MPVNASGITTGLLGYSLKKELLGEALFYRETETFNFEVYSIYVTGNPTQIQQTIINEFTGKYSGDINVKVFEVPGDYTFPNDAVRASKFNVQLERRNNLNNLNSSNVGLTGVYYKGVDANFFASYASLLTDFREDFGFESSENGNQTFNHNLSFGILSGNSKNVAVQIASGIFSNDKDTTFGIGVLIGSASLGDTGTFQDYFSETYDTIRNVYSFNKKREILALSGIGYVYNMVHSLDLKDDGIFDVTERGNVKGYLTFGQAQQGLGILTGNSYTRCNNFFNNYRGIAGSISSSALVNLPTKRTQQLNKPALSADYEVSFTNNPNFQSNGVTKEETIELDADEKNLVEMKHRFSFNYGKRAPLVGGVFGLMDAAFHASPAYVSGYYAASNFYNASLPIKQIKYDLTWPSNKTRATVNLDYSNNPKNFVTLNGLPLYSLDYKVQDTKPVDIITEYKVVNRSNHLSVLNYAYQTEKGQISVNIDAGLGRNANEFTSGFRTGISNYLVEMYRLGIGLFMQQFINVVPISFTYQLSDVKYALNSDGILNLTLSFTYTIKKYQI